ncbi:MAG TPA: hypothetical protein VGS08_04815 [Candidatus Saccharimonadales bacterium]|nr:hypothetical protein [Candidatus Saccharimonadales bacterium]
MGAGALSLAAALAACGSTKTVYETPSTAAASPNTGTIPAGTSTQPSATSREPILTFDALGGGSNVIQVYPGPANTAQDKVSIGTFEAGQTAGVVCEEAGRTVTSDPSVGEAYRRSDEWYEIQAGGQEFFATAVYADVSGGPVPKC